MNILEKEIEEIKQIADYLKHNGIESDYRKAFRMAIQLRQNIILDHNLRGLNYEVYKIKEKLDA